MKTQKKRVYKKEGGKTRKRSHMGQEFEFKSGGVEKKMHGRR